LTLPEKEGSALAWLAAAWLAAARLPKAAPQPCALIKTPPSSFHATAAKLNSMDWHLPMSRFVEIELIGEAS
jgi:hypothetical protein